MLVVLFRGVNFGFWSPLVCSEENDIMCTSICSCENVYVWISENDANDFRPLSSLFHLDFTN